MIFLVIYIDISDAFATILGFFEFQKPLENFLDGHQL